MMKDTRENILSENADNSSMLSSVIQAGGEGEGLGLDSTSEQMEASLTQVLNEALAGGGGKPRSRTNSSSSLK